MNSRLFRTVSLPFVVITVTLIHFPFSSYANTEYYQNCSAPFDCAGIRNLSYPFWGPGRPSYCGHPAFELNCSGEAPLMEIQDMSYRVLDVNNTARTLRVAREDYWNKFCPATFVNTTIDFTIFSYSSATTNLMIYYGCPLTDQAGSPTCSINGTEFATYIIVNGSLNSLDTAGCLYNVKVPVLQSAVGTGLNLTEAALIDAIDGGFILGWNARDDLCDTCQTFGGLCGYNTSTSDFTCLCADGAFSNTCGLTPEHMPEKLTFSTPLVISVCVVAGTIAVIFVVTICWKKRHQLSNLMMWKRDIRNNHFSTEEMIKNFGSMGPKRYTYSEVKKLTNSFKDKVGQGGYGSVYKGKLYDGRIVAVKILNESKGNGEEFINEVASISRTSHVNIVNLLGFCYEKTKRALIYEFM